MRHDLPVVTYWRGRPIQELSRDELLEAFSALAYQLAEYQSFGRALALGKVEMLKRGELAAN